MKESVSFLVNRLCLPELAKAAISLGRSIRIDSSMSSVSLPYPSRFDGKDLVVPEACIDVSCGMQTSAYILRVMSLFL